MKKVGALVRKRARQLLGPSGLAALRGAQRHASAAYALLRGRGSGHAISNFVLLDIEELQAGIRRYRLADSDVARDRAIVELMGLVVTDQRYLGLLEGEQFRAGAPEPLGKLLLGAALFGAERVADAYRVFEEAVRTHPSVRAFYCLARCASQGLTDHARSREVAESGLRQFPDSAVLTMLAAVAAYRLDDLAQANRLIDTRRGDIEGLLRGSFPGIDALQAELKRALATRQERRPTAYSDDVIETYWNLLYRNMVCFNRTQHGWASLRWLQVGKLEDAIRNDAAGVDTFINFGAFCGCVDADLATRFPEIAFHAVDLGARTKTLNDQAFRLPNLTCHDAFITDYLDKTDLGGRTAMLFHARTGTLFYPAFLERFYRRCAALGIRYIALWENNSLSHSEAKFFDFDSIPDGSVAYRDVMFIHDYKRLLEGAGYETLKVVKSPSNAVLVEDDALTADGHVFVVARLRAAAG